MQNNGIPLCVVRVFWSVNVNLVSTCIDTHCTKISLRFLEIIAFDLVSRQFSIAEIKTRVAYILPTFFGIIFMVFVSDAIVVVVIWCTICTTTLIHSHLPHKQRLLVVLFHTIELRFFQHLNADSNHCYLTNYNLLRIIFDSNSSINFDEDIFRIWDGSKSTARWAC